jgi:trans-aconitate methyltransferase
VDATRAPLVDVIAYLERELAGGSDAIELDALDPDLGRGRFAGEQVLVDGEPLVHRPLRVWLDLAERLGLRLCTPRAVGDRVRLRFERLGERRLLRGPADTEKYGAGSELARIDKREDGRFVLDLRDALARAGAVRSVLAIGCNTGNELELLRRWTDATLVGIDHSASAIAAARVRFAGDADIVLHEADVTNLAPLALGRFDLVLSIGTLQSGALDDRALLRVLVQDHLAPDGAVILGIPNCRYRDGELEYGARIKNLSEPELGLLVKDVAFYRKYLQQHHRQVFVTGKHYIFVTAIRTREARSTS